MNRELCAALLINCPDNSNICEAKWPAHSHTALLHTWIQAAIDKRRKRAEGRTAEYAANQQARGEGKGGRRPKRGGSPNVGPAQDLEGNANPPI